MLDDVEIDDDIDKLISDSDTEYIAEEGIIPGTSTQDTSLTTPEANLHVVPNDNQSNKKKKKRTIIKVDQKTKSYQARRVTPRTRNTTQST